MTDRSGKTPISEEGSGGETAQQMRERIAFLEKELAQRQEYEAAATHKVTRKNHGLVRIRVVHRPGAGMTIEPRGQSSGKRWAAANWRSLGVILAAVRGQAKPGDGAKQVAERLLAAVHKRWPEHDFEVLALEPEWVVTGPCPGCVRYSTSFPANKFPPVDERTAHAGQACRPRGFERLREVAAFRFPP